MSPTWHQFLAFRKTDDIFCIHWPEAPPVSQLKDFIQTTNRLYFYKIQFWVLHIVDALRRSGGEPTAIDEVDWQEIIEFSRFPPRKSSTMLHPFCKLELHVSYRLPRKGNLLHLDAFERTWNLKILLYFLINLTLERFSDTLLKVNQRSLSILMYMTALPWFWRYHLLLMFSLRSFSSENWIYNQWSCLAYYKMPMLSRLSLRLPHMWLALMPNVPLQLNKKWDQQPTPWQTTIPKNQLTAYKKLCIN